MTKKRSKPNPRKHIPALTPEQMQAAFQKLQDTRLPLAAKKQLQRMLEAAANPNGETVETIIRTLATDRRQLVNDMAAAFTRQSSMVTKRAGQGLDAIPDDEWDRLVNEANNGTE